MKPYPLFPWIEVDDEPLARGGMDVHFSSATDLWATPQDVFDTLNAEFHFETDVCATVENAKCKRYFTPEQNGLIQTWGGGLLDEPSIRQRTR